MTTELVYGTNIGCVRRVSAQGSTPGQCGGPEAAAVPHRYRYPRPHPARLYVCETHANDEPGAEPLTEQDQRVIAARRARRDAEMALVTVGPYAAVTGAASP